MEPSMRSGMPVDRYFDQGPASDRTENASVNTALLHSTKIRHGSPDSRQAASRSGLIFSLPETTTRIWQGKKVCLHNRELLQELQDTHAWPFIEHEATSVLDVRHLVNDVQMRHDLNFNRQMTLTASNTCKQISLARRYFEAVSFELVLYLAEYYQQTVCACGRKSYIKAVKKYAHRLPRFLKAVRQTTKSLVREEHWPVVEQAVDVELLMNQLRNGTSDLFSLAHWLGEVLKQSCSPIRDGEVDTVTKSLRSAMSERDGNKLANGITSLFDIFNTMKLDVANHQMRLLLPPLVDESTEFVQKRYQEQIDKGSLDYRSLWKWFHEQRELFDAKALYEELQDDNSSDDEPEFEANATFPDEDFLTRYAEIVFTEVIKSNTPVTQLPEPFKLDLRRIDTIRRDVSIIYAQQCELMAFNIILRQCKHTSLPSIADESNLLQRTAYIKSQIPNDLSAQRESLAIEIVRAAYQIANHPSQLPSPLHTCQVQDMLDPHTRAGQIVAGTIHSKLHAMLEEIVFEEINGARGISDLLPSQILDRYYSGSNCTSCSASGANTPSSSPSMSAMSGIVMVNAAQSGDSPLALAIRSIAQRLAHVTLMQWRIWAQILWFKSHESIFDTQQEFDAWREDVLSMVQARYPRYPQRMRSDLV